MAHGLLRRPTMRKALVSTGILGLLLGCGGPGQLKSTSTSDERPSLPQTNAPGIDLPRAEWRPVQAHVPEYDLVVSDADWKALHDNEDLRDYYVPGSFRFDGRSWNVEVRLRGQGTRHYPKKSLQIRFPKQDPFFERSRLELLAAWKDGGMLTERLWWDLAEAIGMRVPQTQFVNLNLNGERYGLMVDIERVDKAFLRAHGLNDDGSIYRAGQFDGELKVTPPEPYQHPWEKRTNESEPFDDLWSFLDALSRTPAHELEAMLEQRLDLEGYLTWMALEALIAQDLMSDARIFLIRDPATDRWLFVPWDFNNANSMLSRMDPLEGQWNGNNRPLPAFTLYDSKAWDIAAERASSGLNEGARPTWSVLSTRILDDPRLRERFIDKVRTLLDTHFTEKIIGERVDALAALAAPHLAEDPWVDPVYAAAGADFLKTFVRERREFLSAELELLRNHDDQPWRILRVGVDDGGSRFVQIINSSGKARSIKGLRLTSNLRHPEEGQTLGDVRVGAGEWVTLSEDATGSELELGIEFDPMAAEIGLFQADGRTALDASFLPPLDPGTSYGRDVEDLDAFGWFDDDG